MQQPGAAGGRRQTAVVTCPRSMVGRVIGRNGETIKALQTYTGALIQIDQTCDPTKIAISGTPQSLNMALSMVHDIVRGTFKGFALLRQATGHSTRGPHQLAIKPVYAPGYGLVPPSQLYGGESPVGLLHPGGNMVPPRAGAPGPPGAAYPQLLGAGPLAGAPHHQFVLGVQPIPVTGTAMHNPMYNVIGGPSFGGPVYLSHIDYNAASAGGHLSSAAGAGASGGPADMMLYSDGSSLLAGGGTGSRLFQAVGGMHRGSGGAVQHGLGSHGQDMMSSQQMGGVSYGTSAGGTGHHHHTGGGPGGGGSAAGLLSSGALVMDAEGSLYTYTVDG